MKVAIDFGITVTDILKKDTNSDLFHNSMLSKKKPSENLIKEILEDINLNDIAKKGAEMIGLYKAPGN